jgi:hypothetical protein
MKNTLIALLLLLGLAGCKSCKEEDKGNFTVNLQGYVGSTPLSFSNTIYNDGAGKEFFFSKLKFYLSHIKLVRADNTEVEIKDAAFLDWSDNNWKSFSANVDAGTYKGIKFFVGLDPQQNAGNPDDYAADEPLGPKDDMFWEWLKHRFVVLEGTADTLGNNFGGGNIGLVYHTGRDTCYREVTLSGTEFTVNAEGGKSINLNLDLLKVFAAAPEPVNMFTQPGTQSEDADLPVAIQFSNQFSKSFSYSE